MLLLGPPPKFPRETPRPLGPARCKIGGTHKPKKRQSRHEIFVTSVPEEVEAL